MNLVLPTQLSQPFAAISKRPRKMSYSPGCNSRNYDNYCMLKQDNGLTLPKGFSFTEPSVLASGTTPNERVTDGRRRRGSKLKHKDRVQTALHLTEEYRTFTRTRARGCGDGEEDAASRSVASSSIEVCPVSAPSVLFSTLPGCGLAQSPRASELQQDTRDRSLRSD